MVEGESGGVGGGLRGLVESLSWQTVLGFEGGGAVVFDGEGRCGGEGDCGVGDRGGGVVGEVEVAGRAGGRWCIGCRSRCEAWRW